MEPCVHGLFFTTTTSSYAGLHIRENKLLRCVDRTNGRGVSEEIIQQEVKIKKK